MASKKTRIKRVPATTNNITKAIIAYLLNEGHSASRINVQGQYDPKIPGWRPSGSRKGFFDIAACIKDSNGIGRFVAIDIKKGNDKLSKGQMAFIEEIENAGGLAFEIESYDEFINWYTNYKTTI